jgi:hypothetical protein
MDEEKRSGGRSCRCQCRFRCLSLASGQHLHRSILPVCLLSFSGSDILVLKALKVLQVQCELNRLDCTVGSQSHLSCDLVWCFLVSSCAFFCGGCVLLLPFRDIRVFFLRCGVVVIHQPVGQLLYLHSLVHSLQQSSLNGLAARSLWFQSPSSVSQAVNPNSEDRVIVA